MLLTNILSQRGFPMQYLFHKKRTYFPILSLSVLFLLLLSGCGRQQEYTQSGFYFDTVISLSVYDKDADHAKEVLDGALQLCETYDDLLNESKEGSDIYRINHAQGDYTSVSSETVSLLYTALQYCAVSDGHLDIPSKHSGPSIPTPGIPMCPLPPRSNRHLPMSIIIWWRSMAIK